MREEAFEELRELRARVRRFVIGRALRYPYDGDVVAAVDATCALVHDVTVGP